MLGNCVLLAKEHSSLHQKNDANKTHVQDSKPFLYFLQAVIGRKLQQAVAISPAPSAPAPAPSSCSSISTLLPSSFASLGQVEDYIKPVNDPALLHAYARQREPTQRVLASQSLVLSKTPTETW